MPIEKADKMAHVEITKNVWFEYKLLESKILETPKVSKVNKKSMGSFFDLFSDCVFLAEPKTHWHLISFQLVLLEMLPMTIP